MCLNTIGIIENKSQFMTRTHRVIIISSRILTNEKLKKEIWCSCQNDDGVDMDYDDDDKHSELSSIITRI